MPDDCELHEVRLPALGEDARKDADDVVEKGSPPVVEWPVPAGLVERIDRHLVQARDDDVEHLGRFPLVEIDVLAGDSIGDAASKRVRHGVGNGIRLDVDRVNAACPVQGQLHAEDAAATADVQTGLALADPLAEDVFPAEVAPLGRHEDAGVDGQPGERKREQRTSSLIAPRFGGRLRRREFAVHAVGEEPPPPAGLRPFDRLANGGDVFRSRPTADADDLCSLLAP